jgi:hypothetical protein
VPPKAKPSEGTPQGPVDRGLAAVYFGANSVASTLNLPQERDLPKNHSHSKPNLSNPASQQDISTLRGLGHFDFALTPVLRLFQQPRIPDILRFVSGKIQS